MSGAGDMPESFSGLGEVVRPLSFGNEEPSTDRELVSPADGAPLDRPEDDTVFLAPRRDFSPGGMARDEGVDADIESPFAQLESKTASELMSPMRRIDDGPDRSQQVFETKAPISDDGSAGRMPAPRSEPPLSIPPASSPIAKPSVKLPPLTSPEALPLDNPSLIRPCQVRPTLVQPAAASPRALPPSPRRRPIADIGDELPPSVGKPAPDLAVSKTPPSFPAPAFRPSFGDNEALPRRRPVGALQPKTDPTPERPPPPGRLLLAIGSMSRAGNLCLQGFGTVWAVYSKGCLALARGLQTTWATYSEGCLALQIRLSQLALRALVQARSLVLHSAAALVRLCRISVQRCRIGVALAWTATKAVARQALVPAKAVHSAANQGSAAIGAFLRQMLALAARAPGSLRAMVEGWLAAHAQRRKEAAEAVKAAKAAEVDKAADMLKAQTRAASMAPKASSQSLPVSKAPGPSAATKPAMPSVGEKAVAKPTSVDTALAQPRQRLSWGLGPQRLALAGLAAASIVFLIAAFALSPTTGPANATLIFPIPAKPAIGAIPPNRAESISESETIAASGGATLGVVLALPEIDDPIAEMVAYVGEPAATPPAVSDVNSVLARAGSVEGLSQFVLAAEVVGLKELLAPGETYTIFVPNDEAFAELASGELDILLEPTGHERLLALLSHHVLPGRLSVDDFQGDVHEYTSLAGASVAIDATEAISVGGAGIVEADLQADNGVLHVIDKVVPIVEP